MKPEDVRVGQRSDGPTCHSATNDSALSSSEIASRVLPQAAPASDLSVEEIRLLAWAVSNCHTLARRRLRPAAASSDTEWWQHILRICEKAGARSEGILRASLPTEITNGSGESEQIAIPQAAQEPSLRRDLAKFLDNLYGLHVRPGHLDALLEVINYHAPVKIPLSSPQPEPAPAALTFRGFSCENLKRCEAPRGFNHELSSWDTSDWFLAVLGELGEAANIAKKLNRVRDGIRGNKETEAALRVKLRGEIADAFIYLDLLSQHEGIDLGAAVRETFDAKSREIGYTADLPAAPAPAPQEKAE